jgi:acetyl-CoA acetyltransferase
MSRHPRDAVILGYVRTPVGRYGGALAQVRPDDLAAHVIRAVLERTDIGDDRVDEVVFGATNQAGEDNRNVARMAVLLAGLPDTVPGVTLNRLCASGLSAVVSAFTPCSRGRRRSLRGWRRVDELARPS